MFSKATDTYLAKGGENQYPFNQKLFLTILKFQIGWPKNVELAKLLGYPNKFSPPSITDPV